jgi:hypothetical protein
MTNDKVLIVEPTLFGPEHEGKDVLIHIETSPSMMETVTSFVTNRDKLKLLAAEMVQDETLQPIYSYLDFNNVPVMVLGKARPVSDFIEPPALEPEKVGFVQRIKSWFSRK